MRRLHLFHLLLTALLLSACQAAPPAAPQPQATTTSTTKTPAPRAVTPSPAPTQVPRSPDAFAAPTATPQLPEPTMSPETLASLRPLRTVGFGGTITVQISPDGSLLVAGTTAGLAWYALPSMEHLRFDVIEGGIASPFHDVRIHNNSRSSSSSPLHFSPDGTRVALERAAGGVEVRSVVDGTVLATADGRSPRFSPDGRILATLSNGEPAETTLWDSTSGYAVAALKGYHIDFSADGQYLATLHLTERFLNDQQQPKTYAYTTFLWRVSDGTALRALAGETMPVFSPDGRWLATTQNPNIQLWNIDGTAPDRSLPPVVHYTVQALTFDQQSNLLIVQEGDTRLLVWDTSAERWDERTKNLPEIANPGYCQEVSFDETGSMLVIGKISDCTRTAPGLTFFRTSDGAQFYENPYAISAAFNQPGTYAVVDDMIVHINVNNAATRDLTTLDHERLSDIQTLDFSPNGQMLATGGEMLALWNVTSGALRSSTWTQAAPFGFRWPRLRYTPDGGTLIYDGQQVFFEGCQPAAVAWAVHNRAFEWPRWEETGWCAWMQIQDVIWAFHPDTGASIATLKSAPLDSEQMDGISLALGTPITATALEFSPDGALLALSDDQGTLHLFQSSDGTPIGQIPLSGPARLLRFSQDGTRMAVISGSFLQVLSIPDRRVEHKIATEPGIVEVIFSTDEQLVITGGEQGVTFYSMETGQALHAISVAADDLAFGPHQRILAILHDGQAQLWGIAP